MAEPLLDIRGLKTHFQTDDGMVSSPPTVPGISDILERMQPEEPPSPPSPEGAGPSIHMRERRSIYSKPKRIKDRRISARRSAVPVLDEPLR